MARKMAHGKPAAGAGPRGGGSTLGIVLLTLAAVAALPLTLLMAVGMAPTIVAYIVDRHPRRYLGRTVAAMNLAGMAFPTLALCRAGFGLVGAETVLGDPQEWLIMYGTAAIGWVIHQAMPSVGRVIVDFRANQAQRVLAERAEALVKDWGQEVAGDAAERR